MKNHFADTYMHAYIDGEYYVKYTPNSAWVKFSFA